MPKSTLSKAEAKNLLISFFRKGEIILTKHSRERMAEKNFSHDDIKHVILHGVINTIRFDEDYGDWEIEIEGVDLDGAGLTLQLGLDIQEKKIVLITGHDPRFH